jgi:hypothetical protein
MAQTHSSELSLGTIFIDLLHVGTIHYLGKADRDSDLSETRFQQGGHLDI